jgi:hypothetical protein
VKISLIKVGVHEYMDKLFFEHERKKKKKQQQQWYKRKKKKEAPMHGDILKAIMSHTPACHVSIAWKRVVVSSLGRFNKIKH